MSILVDFLEYWKSGGTLMAPLVAVCFGIWYYYLRLRRRVTLEIEATDDELAFRESGGSVSGKAHHPLAEDDVERSLEMMRRDLFILKALTVVAPLIGLLGTVAGMMATFEAVAGSGGDMAQRVAGGVSRALITTQAGLVVAIPGVFGQMDLRRLLRHLDVRAGALRLHRVPVRAAGRL